MLAEINPVVLPASANSGNVLLDRQYNRRRIYLSKSSPVLRSRSKHIRGYRTCSETKGRGRPNTLVHPNSGCSHFAHLSLEPVATQALQLKNSRVLYPKIVTEVQRLN